MVVTDRFESVFCRFLRRTIGSRGGPTKGDTVSREVVAQFWEAMASNDFGFAARWLHPDFEHFMPQTREYLKGREKFAVLNHAYPAKGRWLFDVQSIVSDGPSAVSDVVVTDGTTTARAITFHTINDGLILRQKEYWPEDYPAPDWRKPWVKLVDRDPF